MLSSSGKVTGDITVSSFNCFGSLIGNVTANMITARKDCFIKGKLTTGSLTVEPGAVIDGEIKAATKDLPPVSIDNPMPPQALTANEPA